MGTPARGMAMNGRPPITGTPAAEAARADMQGSYSLTPAQLKPTAAQAVAAAASVSTAPTSVGNRVTTTHVDNPTPSNDTIVDGMSVTLPPLTKQTTALVSANVSFNAAHPNKFRIYLDNTLEYPTQGYAASSPATDTNDYFFTATQIPIVVPGDGRSHTVSLKYIFQTSTAATTLQDRSLQVSI